MLFSSSLLLSRLLSLCMSVTNSVVLVGFYYGFLTLFSIGPSDLFLLQTRVMEEGTEKEIAATTGLITGQLMMFISIYYAPLYLALGRPHTATVLVLAYLFFHFYCCIVTKKNHFLDSGPTTRNFIGHLSMPWVFLNHFVLQLFNPFVFPSSTLARLLNTYMFRCNNKIVFLTSAFLGWLIGHILFMKWVGLILLRIHKNSWIPSKKYLVSKFKKKHEMNRIFSSLLFITCLYSLNRTPFPIQKQVESTISKTAKKGKKEETISEKKRGEMKPKDRGYADSNNSYLGQEQEPSQELDEEPELSAKDAKLESQTLAEKNCYWFEQPLVTFLFDYNQWHRPLRYLKNAQLKKNAVRNEMSQYFFYPCPSDGKQRLCFTYPPGLSTFLEMIERQISLYTTETLSQENKSLYKNWVATNEENKQNMRKELRDRVFLLERTGLNALEKKVRLYDEEKAKEKEKGYLPEEYDPFVNGPERGTKGGFEKEKGESEKEREDFEEEKGIKTLWNLLFHKDQELEDQKNEFVDYENQAKRPKRRADGVTLYSNYETIYKEIEEEISKEIGEGIGPEIEEEISEQIEEEIGKDVPRWLYQLTTSKEKLEDLKQKDPEEGKEGGEEGEEGGEEGEEGGEEGEEGEEGKRANKSEEKKSKQEVLLDEEYFYDIRSRRYRQMVLIKANSEEGAQEGGKGRDIQTSRQLSTTNSSTNDTKDDPMDEEAGEDDVVVTSYSQSPDFRRNLIRGSMRAQRRKTAFWRYFGQHKMRSPLFADFLPDFQFDGFLTLLWKEVWRYGLEPILESFQVRITQELEPIFSSIWPNTEIWTKKEYNWVKELEEEIEENKIKNAANDLWKKLYEEMQTSDGRYEEWAQNLKRKINERNNWRGKDKEKWKKHDQEDSKEKDLEKRAEVERYFFERDQRNRELLEEHSRTLVSEGWDRVKNVQMVRSWALLTQAFLRRHIKLPFLILVKNIGRMLLLQYPEFSEDWKELENETHVICSYSGIPLAENKLPETWRKDGFQIKILFPFRVKPWQGATIPTYHKNQGEDGDFSYLTASGQEVTIPFSAPKQNGFSYFFESFSYAIFQEWARRYRELKETINRKKEEIFQEILRVLRDVVESLRNEKIQSILKKLKPLEKNEKSQIFSLELEKNESVENENNSIITNFSYEEEMENYSYEEAMEKRIQHLIDRTITMKNQIEQIKKKKEQIISTSDINIMSPQKTDFHDKKSKLQKHIWRIFKGKRIRFIRKSRYFVKSFIERIYIHIFPYIINTVRQFSPQNEKMIELEETFPFALTIKKLEESSTYYDLSSVSQAYVLYKISETQTKVGSNSHLRSVLQYDGTYLFLEDEIKNYYETQGIFHAKSKHKQVKKSRINEWKNWLKNHHQYHLPETLWSCLGATKWRYRANRYRRKNSMKCDSHKEKKGRIVEVKQKDDETNLNLALDRRKKFSRICAYDRLLHGYINYENLEGLYNTEKQDPFHSYFSEYATMSIGNSLTTKKDKEKEQNEWSRKLQNLLEAGKIQEAWEKEMKRERKYYGNPIHRRFFQLVHSTRQERKAMDRHGDIAKKIQLLKRKRELNQRVLKEFLRLPAYKKKGPDQIWKMIQNSNCSEMEDILSDLFKAFQKAHTDLNPGRKVEAPESDLNPEMEASQSNRKRTFFKKFLNWMGVGRKKKEDEEDEEDEEELYTWIALRIHQEMRMNHKSFQPRENKKLFLPEFEMLDDARNLYMENPEMWWRASIEEMFDLEQDPNKNLTASSNQKKDSKLEKKNQAKKNQQQQSQADRDSNVKEKDKQKKYYINYIKKKKKEEEE
uniref:Protein TIC 214 n=1 Tax=Najas flexilis TaxID=29650 RepID=S4TBC6_9LILI|nr:putative membrane protein RF19 [Najas flexilis]YP_008378833.1 putative membrane protein RF19 [Najas flexilis]AFY64112.1 putative membrane protein RF19 [Najas flexilis]AFY64113.1 putative membrane protein RF19 [Najas flexilis]